MATKPSLVLLGYIEDQISARKTQGIDYACNKVGGSPDWCISGCDVPCCKRCGRKQALVIQLYAPLEGSCFHRTLYLFACVTQECWNKSHSWTCLRSQLIDPSTMTVSPTTCSPPPGRGSDSGLSCGEKWLDDENDWSSNDNEGNFKPENLNLKSSSIVYLSNMSKTGNNLNTVNANKTTTIQDIARSMESQLNISKSDPNANETVCGAVGMEANCGSECGPESSAVIEGSEGDMIAVDTPEQPTTDIPALFQEAAHIDANADVNFVSYFIGSDFEPVDDVNFTDYERELLLRYTHNTGHEIRVDVPARGESKGDGLYEKYMAHHGDLLLHKFKKRIARSPQQILRYCREEGSLPLWLHTPGLHDTIGKCTHCGGRMVFEMQVTPQLVISLKVPGVQGTPLEFGTVAVFTCFESCWTEGDKTRQEYAAVQCEVI